MKRLLFLLVMLWACGGTQEEEVKPAPGPTPTAPPKKVTSGDVSFEIAPLDIKGTVFQPEALDRPGMPLVEAKRATTVPKQCKLVQTTKEPVQKQAQAAILATMLYVESKSKPDDKKPKPDESCNKLDDSEGRERALLKEARQVLRDVAQQVGDKAIDEITLRLLGSYEIILGDYPAAEKAWAQLIDKDPKSKELLTHRAWLAYAQLKQFKNGDALASLNGEKADDKEPELAYVMAWAKIRTGDLAGAWQAISAAARGWAQNTRRDELEREVLWFAGRGNVPLDQATALISGVLVKVKPQPQQPQQQYEMLAKLGLSGYALAGRWNDGAAALDKALEVPGYTAPPNDLPVIRFSQADFTVRLDAPDVAARFAKQAIEAIGVCGDKCADKDKAAKIQDVYLMGRLFHVVYATANDHRYYQPAHELYELTIPKLDAASRTDAEQNMKKLEATLKNMKVGTGTHDKGAIEALLNRHYLEVSSCYEVVLGTNPKLGGRIALSLESDATGAIKGVSTEPKAGAAELSAIAGCIAERAKHWKLPKRGMPGTTRIKLSYNLAVK
ncbi:MAG: hypothetical protein E6J90_26205 [Deltaproteobacteria bacterium]|nr:MAG: hypothetical protein E6J91_24420 [Deltaproteobacteria bacterium]TMQ14860.1 MAG: hypothetical protein E6J90_26205 [Deltaproteobacteria bacterium]